MALALTTGAARAAELHPRVGKLPGFPAMRGVVPVLGSSAAVAAHEKLVTDAFAAANTRASRSKAAHDSAEPNKELLAECADEAAFLATHDVCYRGGPVLRDPTIHLIFWQGPVEEDISKEKNVRLFPPGYIETVKRYFQDVAHDSGQSTNVFAVDPQYGDQLTAGSYTPGEYAMKFDASTDITVDNQKFPSHTTAECNDESEFAKGPCLLDSDIQAEAEKVAGKASAGLRDIYVVLTPPGVGGCFEESSGACAYKQYCAYHGDFSGDGVTVGQQTLYADLPFVGEVQGCDSMVHPNGTSGADAVIDDASHEVNETITDPIGSQCEAGAKRVSECERNAWTDVVGQEIADKCLPPESTVAGSYGEALGGADASTLFNQLIDGDHYYTQRLWSNEAGVSEGGCVQRTIGASFSVSAGPAATVPTAFDGSASGAPGDPAVYWVWDFEGEQIGTASTITSYTFAQPGQHVVALTAYDAYGNGQATVESVNVGAAPAPPPPPPATVPPVTSPPPVLVKEPPAHFTAAQLAAKLGLPANGKRLAGGGHIALGHAECPPACALVLRLYANVTSTTHGHRSTKLVQIGSLHLTIAAKGNGALSLALDARGRALLRKSRALLCQLQITVEGQEGGAWQIARSLTLTR